MDRAKRNFLIVPLAVWFFLLMAGPLVLMVIVSFTERDEFGLLHNNWNLESFRELFDPIYSRVLIRTLLMAAANTGATLLFAFPFAFYLSRLPRDRAMALLTLVMIPFWTNFLIRVLAFVDILRMEPFGLSFLYTPIGVLGALIYNYLPFAILPLYASLEKIDNSLLEAASDLGASRRQILFRVLLPLTRTGIVTAAVLVFIPSLGEYLIPEIVGGGKVFVLGTFLHHQFLVARNWPLGAAAITLLVVIAAVILWAGNKSLRETSR